MFPAIAVLPPVFVVTALAATVEPKVVTPVELIVSAPRDPFVPAPTAASKVTLPDPLDIVSVLSAADAPPPPNINAEPLVEPSV